MDNSQIVTSTVNVEIFIHSYGSCSQSILQVGGAGGDVAIIAKNIDIFSDIDRELIIKC